MTRNSALTRVRIGRRSMFLDPVSGSTDDYVYAHGVKYAFALELRRGFGWGPFAGFIIDKSEIQPSFEEVWSGIVAMCDAIAAKED